MSRNPLIQNFNTPFEVPPFSEVKNKHYIPAIKYAIKQHNKEIGAIIKNIEKSAFENTIVALDKSGKLLNQIKCIFFNLLNANTSPALQNIAKKLSLLSSKHDDSLLLNPVLFSKIESVYNNEINILKNPEDKQLLELKYKYFIRGGAKLNAKEKTVVKKINNKLALLTLKFGDTILNETNNYKLVIDNLHDLDGLPQNFIDEASIQAKKDNLPGKWVFTLHKPSLLPFMQYIKNRSLRGQLYKAYIMRGNNPKYDNKSIVKKIVSLRLQRAKLLGFENHAEYIISENMAKTPEKVYKLLNQLWKPSIEAAKSEINEMQNIIGKEGNAFELEAWDWWFYAEKVRKLKYDIDEESLRPYFKLENVKNGAFEVAKKLYGIYFKENKLIPKYHNDVETYEVYEDDNILLGILYMDFFPRTSKRVGAWVSRFRTHSFEKNKRTIPIISLVTNFTKPTDTIPSLLSFDEVKTLFHEFGHALHGLFSMTKYQQTITVPRDFVELPSQIMENWAAHPEVLKEYAKHYKSSESIPSELNRKLDNSKYFNQGFTTTEYLAASFLDLDIHCNTNSDDYDVLDFETKSMSHIGLIPEIASRYQTTNFNHIFNSGYSAGYYSYIYAQVLDADAFDEFLKAGLYDKQTASSFREKILEKGGSEDAMILYKNFKKTEPKISALLKRKGFTTA